MTLPDALKTLENAGSEYSKKTATALKILLDDYNAQKVRQVKLDRAIHALVKDIESIDKVIEARKAVDAQNLKDFLTKAEGV